MVLATRGRSGPILAPMTACRVLLVEDSTATRTFVTSILEDRGGYEVEEVANGFEALRALPRADFDLVIVDINIPDISGIELASFVRASARHASLPVIAISTEGSKLDAGRALAAGATLFLAKPFGPDQLMNSIGEALAAPRADGGGD